MSNFMRKLVALFCFFPDSTSRRVAGRVLWTHFFVRHHGTVLRSQLFFLRESHVSNGRNWNTTGIRIAERSWTA